MPVWRLNEIESKLTATIWWCVAAQVVLLAASIFLPAVVWAPALIASVGVELSCGMQLNRIDDERFKHWLENSLRNTGGR